MCTCPHTFRHSFYTHTHTNMERGVLIVSAWDFHIGLSSPPNQLVSHHIEINKVTWFQRKWSSYILTRSMAGIRSTRFQWVEAGHSANRMLDNLPNTLVTKLSYLDLDMCCFFLLSYSSCLWFVVVFVVVVSSACCLPLKLWFKWKAGLNYGRPASAVSAASTESRWSMCTLAPC